MRLLSGEKIDLRMSGQRETNRRFLKKTQASIPTTLELAAIQVFRRKWLGKRTESSNISSFDDAFHGLSFLSSCVILIDCVASCHSKAVKEYTAETGGEQLVSKIFLLSQSSRRRCLFCQTPFSRSGTKGRIVRIRDAVLW
jgi:hypothetical protein